jgi:dTDP-glucose pyrophosphorylase
MRLNNWKVFKGLKCVVLCAGRGMRMDPMSAEKPKVMLQIHGKPIIHYVIEYWRQFTDDFILIVGYKKDMVIEYVSSLPIKTRFIVQAERKGIAHAILLTEKEVNERFIVVLGDCLCNGSFSIPDEMIQGVGVWRTENKQDIHQSYSVEIKGRLITKVVEKPKVLVNNLCGIGFYFFRNSLFKYIKETPPSSLRNEVEITDVIQKMIESGENISPVMFEGDYINITYPDDIHRAEKIMKEITRSASE